MLTNTLLLYMTQEALAKARARLTARKDEAAPEQQHAAAVQPAWQLPRHRQSKAAARQALRH